jgi:hypothetical protein
MSYEKELALEEAFLFMLNITYPDIEVLYAYDSETRSIEVVLPGKKEESRIFFKPLWSKFRALDLNVLCSKEELKEWQKIRKEVRKHTNLKLRRKGGPK